jgi:hypothetical protein
MVHKVFTKYISLTVTEYDSFKTNCSIFCSTQVLKKHVGRRILLLMSELGMAVSQIAMGIYFYILNGIRTSENASYSDMDNVRWLPLPILIIFTGEQKNLEQIKKILGA